ncbi:uncharacterized protein Dvir_GJ26473, isoform A [Drosophila virilis]|uniref:Uncharacterized protein, isoform A n=2 Tax=Drosophila virilis TaxID=7244 RepID=A0A0Q9W902_DROVI|nr:uncharacterized protein Dvir_GJ26473, isoform A [Drosophila virilis]
MTSIQAVLDSSTGRPAYAGFLGSSGFFSGSTAFGSTGGTDSVTVSLTVVVVVTVTVVLVSSDTADSTFSGSTTVSVVDVVTSSGIGAFSTGASLVGSSSSSENVIGSSMTSIQAVLDSSTGRPAYAGFLGSSSFCSDSTAFGSTGSTDSLTVSFTVVVVVTVTVVLLSSDAEDSRTFSGSTTISVVDDVTGSGAFSAGASLVGSSSSSENVIGSSMTSIQAVLDSSTGRPAYAGFLGSSSFCSDSTAFGSTGSTDSLTVSFTVVVVVTVTVVLLSSDNVDSRTVSGSINVSVVVIVKGSGAGAVSTGDSLVESSSSSEKVIGSSMTSIQAVLDSSTGRPAYAGFFGSSGFFSGSIAFGSSGSTDSLTVSLIVVVVVTVTVVLLSSDAEDSRTFSGSTTISVVDDVTGSGAFSTGASLVGSSSSSENVIGSSMTSIQAVLDSSTGSPAYAGFLGSSGFCSGSTAFGSTGSTDSLTVSFTVVVVVTVTVVLMSSDTVDSRTFSGSTTISVVDDVTGSGAFSTGASLVGSSSSSENAIGSSMTSIQALLDSSTGSPAYAGFLGSSSFCSGSTAFGSTGSTDSLTVSFTVVVVVTVTVVLVSSDTEDSRTFSGSTTVPVVARSGTVVVLTSLLSVDGPIGISLDSTIVASNVSGTVCSGSSSCLFRFCLYRFSA